MSAGLVRYFETDAYGRRLDRVLYALSGVELPDPIDGAKWQLDTTFDRATELLSAPTLKDVFGSVLKRGFEIVRAGGPT
ncbi:hypothetical protein ABIF81_002406 [Bradyrhizobium daqingense]